MKNRLCHVEFKIHLANRDSGYSVISKQQSRLQISAEQFKIMEENTRVNYYILFENYTQGLMMQDLLKGEKISSRIAPAPRSIQGELGCGMSLLIQPEDIEAVKACIKKNGAEYYDIVPLPCQINPRRNKFC